MTPFLRRWPVRLPPGHRGTLTAPEVEHAMAAQVGPITDVRFTDYGLVSWSGRLNGAPIRGSVRVRVDAEPSYLTTTVELHLERPRADRVADRYEGRVGASEVPDGSLARRRSPSEEIANVGKELIQCLMTKPRVATPEIIEAVSRMIELAESEAE